MISLLVLVGALIGSFLAGRRALWLGLTVVFMVGYGYGIWRANLADTYSYLTFDAAVFGLFASQFFATVPAQDRLRASNIRLWFTLLAGWPALLLCLSALAPGNHPLVELVGFRGNAFLLPFLLLGARLARDDLSRLGTVLAVLNLCAVTLGVVEFFVGLAPFFPKNDITELIYRSRDLVGWTAYRIPSSFSSAHAFAGSLVASLPLIVGAWVQAESRSWLRYVLLAAIVASIGGVFMAAARIHMITAVLIVFGLTLSRELRRGQWVKWLAGVAVIAYIVAGDARLQRLTTLRDSDMVSTRIGTSVNEDFFEVVAKYPLGNGLAGGGTSIPYFLRDVAKPAVVIENEYARIALEQGVPGLLLWIGFVGWVLVAAWRTRSPWPTARRLQWLVCLSMFSGAVIGTGMLTSVPQSSLMLLMIGWATVPGPLAVPVTDEEPIVRQLRRPRRGAATARPTTS